MMWIWPVRPNRQRWLSCFAAERGRRCLLPGCVTTAANPWRKRIFVMRTAGTIMKNGGSRTFAVSHSKDIAVIIHLLMQNSDNQNIVRPDRVKNDVALKLSAHHTRN